MQPTVINRLNLATYPHRLIVVWVLLFSQLAGCTLNHPPRNPLTPTQLEYLLSGRGAFDDVQLPEVPSHLDFLTLDPAMQRLVADTLAQGPKRPPASRIATLLLEKLSELGYFNNTYSAAETFSAKDTFSNKRGNCLSFTNLFIALSREAGLRVQFQLVDVPPSWQSESNYVLRNLHINAIVLGSARRSSNRGAFSVDFNHVQTDPEYAHRTIDDSEARSLFLSNIGVGHLLEDELEQGFVYLRESIKNAPENADHWINLAAFYATSQAHQEAIHAYHRALELKPRSRSALAGLGRVHARLGESRKAQQYQRLARRYRDRNPYFHYGRARALYGQGDHELALASINRAIKLKKNSGNFYLLLGQIQHQLAAEDAARLSFTRAAKIFARDKSKIADDMVPSRVVRTYRPSVGPDAEQSGVQVIKLNK